MGRNEDRRRRALVSSKLFGEVIAIVWRAFERALKNERRRTKRIDPAKAMTPAKLARVQVRLQKQMEKAFAKPSPLMRALARKAKR